MRLRGHHLICLHYYHGEGYERSFVDNLSDLIRRAEAGETVIVAAGPDDVCLVCPYLEKGRCSHREESEEEIQDLDARALKYLQVQPGTTVTWAELGEKVRKAPTEWFQHFCQGCDWLANCDRHI